MKLLSLSLTNIGPFRNQTRTIDFRPGSYLVQAPIGSGKSFLFFDGPIFALYKKNKRPMLNMHSTSGQIICIFETEGQQYTIQRDITRTKTGESVKSHLTHHNEIVTFKNEIDLQQTLNSLLPPLEVFLGTQMLMQDSANIFELDPKDRLEIFKHVFNLIGIDEAKNKLSDYKRELGAMIKARADTSLYDQKLQPLITTLITTRPVLTALYDQYHLHNPGHETRASTLHDRSLLKDKLTIDLLSLPESGTDFSDLISHIEIVQSNTIALQTEQTHILEQQRTHTQSLQQLESNLHTQQGELTRIEQQIQSYDPAQFDQINTNISRLQSQLTQLSSQLDLISIHAKLKGLQGESKGYPELEGIFAEYFARKESDHDILGLQHFLSLLKDKAKDYTYLQTLSQQSLSNQQEQQILLIEQKTKIQERIQALEQTIEQQRIFHCNKINGNCPYIDLINTATFKTLQQQLQSLVQERDSLTPTALSTTVIKDYTNIIHHLRDTFTQIDRKHIEQIANENMAIHRQLQQTQSQRSLLQQQSQKITTLKEKAIEIKSLISNSNEQYHTLNNQLGALQEKITDINGRIAGQPSNTILQQNKVTVTNYNEQIKRLSQLISDFKEIKHEVKSLKEDEKIVSDLYQIFARELLLIVVQKSLPQLQDLMNSYLSQVVDYQIMMEIDKKSANSDSIDLFVTIIDEQGPREVKSLSGGQKVILKLVRMMAIATMTRSQMLFLDETINNLDGDTVSKVAELLKNFVEGKGNNFMLYVVTHSHQIQEMNIWDETVELKRD